MSGNKQLSIWIVRGLALCALLAAACSAPAQPAATTAPSKPAEQQPAAKSATQPTAQPAAKTTAVPAKPTGEVVYVGSELAGEKWDPSITTQLLGSTGFGIGGPIFESLYLHMPPNGEAKPWLLESGTMSPDGMTWTLKLRDGIRFSNGDPMTAEDVKFSLDRYRSEAAVSASAALFRQRIVDVQVVDRLTTKVTMKEPFITFNIYLAGKTGNEGIMMPKKYIEQVGWDAYNKQPIGSGPYRMVEHKTGESVTYEAVDNHWRTTPLFARVRNLIVPEERSRIAMLQAGQADMIRIFPDSKKEIEGQGFAVLNFPGGTMYRIHFSGHYGDYPDNPLKKLEVRKALTLGLDKQALLDALYAGAGDVAPYAHSMPGVALGAPKLPPTPYDPNQAKQLLAQAGYPNGFPLTLWAPNIGCSVDETRRFAEATAAYWEQIGVKVSIKPVDYASIQRPMITAKVHPPEMVGTASTFCTSPSPLAERDLSTFWSSTGTFKLADAADAEIKKAQTAKTLDELVQASEAAYRKIYESYQNIGVFHGGALYGVSKKLADYPITAGFDDMMVWLTADSPK